MMGKWIDVRSDTVTWPTEAMRKAMAEAPVGDDVYGDDPTVLELERTAAMAVGKEASLFVASGTMGNQLAVFTHVKRGEEVILGETCHILWHEAGGAAIIAGAQLRPAPDAVGWMDPKEVLVRIRVGDDIHEPKTGLVCLENAHGNGRVAPLSYMKEIRAITRERGIPVHLDGARLFNAAVALGVPAAVVAAEADSVMFCLSKGLCAPVGSVLAGSRTFVDAARRKRKVLGGGWRQAGILAAAGLLSVKEMTLRLPEDHARAKRLARLLSGVPGLEVQTDRLDINMVYAKLLPAFPLLPDALAAALSTRGILMNGGGGDEVRIVTHHWIDDADVNRIAVAFAELAKG